MVGKSMRVGTSLPDTEQIGAHVRKKVTAHRDPKVDRRVLRTRRTLQDTLISLILEKGYEAITITDICDEAKIGRSTFYAHFASKDDLKRSGLEHLRSALVHAQRQAPTGSGCLPLRFSLSIFEHARDHLNLYRALAAGRGGAVALESIRKIVGDLVRGELSGASEKETGVPRELAVQYVVGGYMAVLTWWLDRGAKLRPETVDAMFRQMATQGALPTRT
jgi:AcrR family transcriptional regulator